MQGFIFDATNVAPRQMGDKVPPGMYPAVIKNTYGKKNDNTPGGQLVIEFETPAGVILSRYNLWNQSEKAVEIARSELSALCYATGVFRLDCQDSTPIDQYARELRGARCTIEVKLQDPSKPDGYVEVKKVYDVNGNEPGKSGTGAAPQPQQANWGNNNQQQQNNNSGGWGNTNQQSQGQQQPNPQPQQGQQGGGWNNNQQPQNNNQGGNGAPAGAGSPPWVR